MATKLMQFKLGNIVATPGALAALESNDQNAMIFLSKHISGNWGDVCPEDWEANNQALENGSRILSSYHLKDDTKLWIITEAMDDAGNRSATTLLLPDEY
nr:hypothetical protein 21 [Candidatus Hydrogenedentota bacterium]